MEISSAYLPNGFESSCLFFFLLFSCSVMSNSLRSHRPQHARLPCSSPELAQTHVHWIDDAIQPSHPLLPPSPPVFNLSQHQSLFQWVNSLHQMAKVLGLQLQSFQWILGIDFLSVWLVESPCCPRDSQESTPAPQFEKHEFFGAQPSLWSNSHICTGLLEKP